MLASLCKAVIRLYWYAIPKENRIVCLYKDHCSQHVYNAFDREGFVAGMKAFLKRYKNCNNNYTCELHDGSVTVKTATGEVINETEISDLVLSGCRVVLNK